MACSTSRVNCSGSATSVGTASASPPICLISSTRAFNSSSRRAARTTRAPWRASSRAVAAPIPELAPVTIATSPANGLPCCFWLTRLLLMGVSLHPLAGGTLLSCAHHTPQQAALHLLFYSYPGGIRKRCERAQPVQRRRPGGAAHGAYPA